MDRATLPHAKSQKNHQAASAAFEAHCYTDRYLSVISTHIKLSI